MSNFQNCDHFPVLRASIFQCCEHFFRVVSIFSELCVFWRVVSILESCEHFGEL